MRQGERTKVALLVSNIFLIISVLLVLKPLFTSNLLSYHGIEIMPLAYLCIAVVAVVVQMILNTISRNAPLVRVMTINTIVQIIILSTIAVLVWTEVNNIYISLILYVYISIFALVTVTYFYQYCQSLLTIRDAKRVYAYIGSGAIAGGVFGGYYTSYMIPYIGSTGLVVSAAIFMVISIIIIFTLNSRYTIDFDDADTRTVKISNSSNQFSILRNQHVRNIALILGLGVIVSKLIDYQFNFLAFSAIDGQNNLTAYFGFWFSTINVVGLAIQMLLVSPLIDRLGVTKSISIMPIMLLIGSAAIIFLPVVGLGLLLKAVEGSLKQSLYKTSSEINFMPLSDSLRNKAKSFVDIVVDSLATGLAGITIYLLINHFVLPFYVVSLACIALIVLWLLIIYRSHNSYQYELSQMIEDGSDSSKVLGSSKTYRPIEQYIKIKKKENVSLKKILYDLTRDADQNIRRSAIKRYCKRYRKNGIKDLKHVLDDSALPVRKQLLSIMIDKAKNPIEIEDLFARLDDTNYILATAVLSEAIGSSNNQRSTYRLRHKIDIATGKINLDATNKYSIALHGYLYVAITHCKYILRYNIVQDAVVNYIDKSIQFEALKAIRLGNSVRLYNQIKFKDIHPENYTQYFKLQARFPVRFRKKLEVFREEKSKLFEAHLPALAYIDSQENVNYMFTLLDHSRLRIKRKVLLQINALSKKFPHLSFSRQRNERRFMVEVKRLKKLAAIRTAIGEFQSSDITNEANIELTRTKKHLKRSMDRSILSAFILMSLILPEKDLSVIYRALRSSKKDAALDFLEGILDYKYKRLFLPVLDVVINKRFNSADLQHAKIRRAKNRQITDYLKEHQFFLLQGMSRSKRLIFKR